MNIGPNLPLIQYIDKWKCSLGDSLNNYDSDQNLHKLTIVSRILRDSKN